MESKRASSGRKQWAVHDHFQGSLNRLRKELATDGCPESQVVLAKHLLNSVEDPNQANARLGVYWLLKASDQGNKEATDLLKECMLTGKGISEQNYLDVQSCIAMSQDEKLARRAARDVFASLSNGSEYITSVQLQRKMLDIDSSLQHKRNECSAGPSSSNSELMNNLPDSDESEEDVVDWSQRTEPNEKLTEDNLVEAAMHYTHGQLPLVNRVLTLSNYNSFAPALIPFVHQSLLHPLHTLSLLYFKLIRFLARISLNLQTTLKCEFQLLFLSLIFALISTDSLLQSFPMITYYVTIVVMIVATFRMLQTKREFFDFRIWSGLFLTYSGGELNAEQAEYQYIKNNLKPYGQFFLALLINLLVYPIISELYIPQSELTLLSLCMTFMTLFGFMYKKRLKTLHDYWILLSFALNVLAKYPYEADTVVTQGWRYLDLKIPTFTSYLIGKGIDFCINFKLLLYAFISAIFCKVAHRDNWRGIYMFLIPHCVTLSWFQIAVISSQGATMYGLIRATLALVGAVMFIPLAGLTTIVLPAAALSKWIIANDHFYTICLFLVLTTAGIAISFCIAKAQFRSNIAAQMQIAIAAMAIYFFINYAMQDSDNFAIETKPDANAALTYEQFTKFCQSDTIRHRNTAHLQLHCAKLEGAHISWQGYVDNVQIASTTNNYKQIIHKLPSFLRTFLYSYLGEQRVPEKFCDAPSEECLRLFNLMVAVNGNYHLGKYDLHVFEMSVKMQASLFGGKGPYVMLVINSAELQTFCLKLRRNDQIWFKGVLSKADSQKSAIQLQEIGCMNCEDISLTLAAASKPNIELNSAILLDYLLCAMRTLFNALVYPISVF